MKKIVLAIIIAFLLFASVSCRESEEQRTGKLFQDNFILISNSEGLYGLMNQDFEMIVDYQYDKIHSFHNGLAIVSLDRDFGVINSLGEIIIPLEYDEIISHDDNQHFRAHNRYVYSYFDSEGIEMTIREYWLSVGANESDMFAFFRINADAYGFTDIDGNVVIRPIYNDVYYDYFSDYNYVSSGGKWGIVKSTGELTVTPTFRKISSSNVEGLTNVYLNGKWGLVENGSRYLFHPEYDMEFLFTETGLATASKNGLFGIVNKDGEEVVPIVHESLNSTNKSLYHNHIISLVDETNYLYDSTGSILYQTDLRIDNFNSKFILMTDLENNTRYIKDYENNTILEFDNDNLYYFSNLDTDFIFKRKLIDDKICTIVYDETGQKINPENVYFNNVIGYNYSNKKLIGFTSCGSPNAGFIDETGEWVIDPIYQFKYYYIYNDYILANVDGLWGLLGFDGELILDFEYSSIGW